MEKLCRIFETVFPDFATSVSRRTIFASENYDLLIENEDPTSHIPKYHKSQKLPKITYNQRLKPIFGNGDKWYNTINFSMNSKIRLEKKIGRFLNTINDLINY